MLIVSDFHDYYDTAAVYGIDKTVIYHRKIIEIPADRKFEHLPYREDLVSDKLNYEVRKHIVGFCGYLYPVIEFKPSRHEQTFASEYLYKPEQVTEYLEKNNMEYPGYRFLYHRDYSVKDPKTMKKYFETSEWTFLLSAFMDYKCPIFLYTSVKSRHDKIVLNPQLKSLKFMPVKDAASAFQDIYMYISGVLGVKSNPMVTISDKDKQSKHGHDGKYSFKKPPGKKGKPRWR